MQYASESFEMQKINTDSRSNLEQILQLIEQIDASVKGDDFSAALAQNIVQLHLHLKSYGQHLEQSFKSKLNRLFVSLRQVCCRDTGQLGSLCLLRIMELVELRAMGWRSSLAHTQYYLSRNERYANCKPTKAGVSEGANAVAIQLSFNATSAAADKQESPVCETVDSCSVAVSSSQLPYHYHNSEKPQVLLKSRPSPPLMPVPLNVPPTPNNSSNNTSLHSYPNLPPPLPCSTSSATTAASHGSYFIIPAAGSCWSAAQLMSAAATAMAASTFLPPLPPPPPPPQPLVLHCGGNLPSTFPLSFPSPTQIFLSGGDALLESLLTQQAAAATNSGLHSGGGGSGMNKSSLQFREDMVIRNSDSGKVMGVKGRRVALVEALSGTIISFQKVDAKCRERILTISGSSLVAIGDAKRLIQETIRRNVSPARSNSHRSELMLLNDENNNSTYSCDNVMKNVMPSGQVEHRLSNTKTADGNDGRSETILFRRDDNGKLQLCCNDPSVLQAAQTALIEYFNQSIEAKNDVGGAVSIGACREETTLTGRKCRRTASFDGRVEETDEHVTANRIVTPLSRENRWLCRRTISAPNLHDGFGAVESIVSKPSACVEAEHPRRKRYTRTEILAIGVGAALRSFPENMVTRTTDLSETLKEIMKTNHV